MCFKNIYGKVEELKNYSVSELIELLDIELIYSNELEVKSVYMKKDKPIIILQVDLSGLERDIVLLHEIGHHLFNRDTWLYNQRTNENNANLFMCLYLLKNEIWSYEYFDRYLIDLGVTPIVARMFNERVHQHKLQVKYELAY